MFLNFQGDAETYVLASFLLLMVIHFHMTLYTKSNVHLSISEAKNCKMLFCVSSQISENIDTPLKYIEMLYYIYMSETSEAWLSLRCELCIRVHTLTLHIIVTCSLTTLLHLICYMTSVMLTQNVNRDDCLNFSHSDGMFTKMILQLAHSCKSIDVFSPSLWY